MAVNPSPKSVLEIKYALQFTPNRSQTPNLIPNQLLWKTSNKENCADRLHCILVPKVKQSDPQMFTFS